MLRCMKAPALVVGLLGCTWSLAAPAQLSAPRQPPPEPQSLAELIDSFSDNALTGERSQFYRVDGRRRIVALGRGWSVGPAGRRATGRAAVG